MRTQSLVFPLLLVLTMLLVACYPPATPVPPVGESADTSLTLVGPIWSLTTLNGEPIQPDTIITAQFGPDGLRLVLEVVQGGLSGIPIVQHASPASARGRATGCRSGRF